MVGVSPLPVQTGALPSTAPAFWSELGLHLPEQVARLSTSTAGNSGIQAKAPGHRELSFLSGKPYFVKGGGAQTCRVSEGSAAHPTGNSTRTPKPRTFFFQPGD